MGCGVDALGQLAAAGEPDHVFVGGSSRMGSAFDAVETVRSVLSILEQQLVVVELIEHILDRGLSVAIGAEHGCEPLAACALVVAPVAGVERVGEQLGEHLGAGTSPGRLGLGRPKAPSRGGPGSPAKRRREPSGGG